MGSECLTGTVSVRKMKKFWRGLVVTAAQQSNVLNTTES